MMHSSTLCLVLVLLLVLLHHITCVVVPSPSATSKPALRIGLVGSGISSAALTHFIHTSPLTKHYQVHLDVYESSSHVGGRLDHVEFEVSGSRVRVEKGASIIDESNQYMIQFAHALNLTLIQPVHVDSSFALFDGSSFVYRSSDWWLLDVWNMFAQFGLYSLLALRAFVIGVATKFHSFYRVQRHGHAFDNVPDLLRVVGLYQLTQSRFDNVLEEQLGFEQFESISPLAAASVRVNYAQALSVNAMAGAVGIIPLFSSRLLAVQQGNDQIPAGLFSLHGAHVHLSHEVSTVERMPSGVHRVHVLNRALNTSSTRDYHVIVIATPLELTNIKFQAFKLQEYSTPPRQFERVYTTFVKGRLKGSAFNLPSDARVPSTILSTAHNPQFNSISAYYHDQNTQQSVYKIFSANNFTSQLSHYFTDIDSSQTREFVWQAYPHFSPPEQFAKFQLDTNLFYINAFENTASCLEVQAVAAKNVALLIQQQWIEIIASLPHHMHYKLKQEL